MFIDIRSAQKEVSMIVSETKVVQSNLVLRTPALYGHLIITRQFALSLGIESRYILSKFNPLLTGFDCNNVYF